jgi:hypothetical protein
MEKIDRDSINGDTPLSVIIKFLEENVEDKFPRDRVDDYIQGIRVGQLSIVDLLVGLEGRNNDKG